jgi:hypothetical protein
MRAIRLIETKAQQTTDVFQTIILGLSILAGWSLFAKMAVESKLTRKTS